ncbi:MAG: type II secretion system protein [Bacilli bacterium]|nr:type II secretion system protein [Bacilli bacterium]
MKKGFTLAELLGVIVLLALVVSISYPLLLNQFEKSEEQIDEYKLSLVYSAAKNYVRNNANDFPYKMGNIACVYVKTLTDNNLVALDLDNISENKLIKLVMTGNNRYTTSLVDECTSTSGIIYKTKSCTTTKLQNSVKYDNNVTYYFENNILVREIDNISIINQNEDNTTSFDLSNTNYKALYDILYTRKGIYTTFDKGEKTSKMFIDINYLDDLYTDDTGNTTIYQNADTFTKYYKNTTYDTIAASSACN